MLFETTKLTRNHKLYQGFVDNFANVLAKKDYVEFSDSDLVRAAGSVLVFDIESYINYFLIAFKQLETHRVVIFEDSNSASINLRKLLWVATNFLLVGFNSKSFDVPMLHFALQGCGSKELKSLTTDLIVRNVNYRELFKERGISPLVINHIDLIDVAPLQASLKVYGGRLHAPRLQDTPFPVDAELSSQEIEIVRHYCINDLDNTGILLNELRPQIALREQLSREIEQDLRSKSDAQIAEAVITSEIAKIKGYRPKKPEIKAGTSYSYNVPAYIEYQTPILQEMLAKVRTAKFVVAPTGSVEMPPELDKLEIAIGSCVYRMGIGGLHSSEKCVAHKATADTMLLDRDVASYYPSIILNLELCPKHLGKAFLSVYRSIVNRRLEAKHNGNKVVADSLKITINGSFGKLGNPYSALYSPDLLIHVTVTGQLALLLLIEMLERVGIPVVSANTDGIVVKCRKDQQRTFELWVIYWEKITGFVTEETSYKAMYCRDVNNYIIVKEDGKTKVKGVYAEKGSALNSVLSKNPECQICNDAVTELLTKGTAVDKTIKECKDIRKFVALRHVKGGAEKSGVYLGRAVRWYYSMTVKGTINYVTNGNTVPKSENAMPCMELPSELPSDIDYEYYIARTNDILREIGYYRTAKLEMPTLF